MASPRAPRAPGGPAPLDVVKRRKSPDLYVLDRSFRVVMQWAGKGSESVLDRETGLLTPAVDRVVRNLTLTHDATEWLGVVAPSLILRIVELDGSAGLHFGVFVESFQARDSLREAARRYSISPRESDVLNLLVQGAATTEIAEALHIAETTVQDHIKNIAGKTGSRSRAEIVARVLGPGV